MFKLSEIKELIKLVDQTSIHELEIENEGVKLAIRKPGRTEVVNLQSAPIAHTYLPSAPSTPVAAVQADATRAAADTSHLHR
ncbi:MAG: accB, partial [Cohnella sp.]|nr:accB [Cohnella sp.]